MSLDAFKWAMDQDTKDPTAKLVLIAICDHFNEDMGYSEWSSYQRIAKIGCCSEKTVQRKINQLVEQGYINKVQRGFSKPNVYYLPIYQIYKTQQKSLHIGQIDQSIQDKAVQHGLDKADQSGVDMGVQQTQYNTNINTNKFGGHLKKELSFKQKRYIDVLIDKIAEKAKHDPQYAYENYEALREKMKNGMLKKDGSFEELLKVYKLD
jgi:DNA-binding transcriptional MocR family regulator